MGVACYGTVFQRHPGGKTVEVPHTHGTHRPDAEALRL
jgi:hypothetical protein